MTYVDSKLIRSSIGAGLVWDSPFGPLRFDYAIPLTKEGYDIVQEFRFGGGTTLLIRSSRQKSTITFTASVGGMTDPIFFKRPQGLTVAEIAALTGATLSDAAHRDRLITGVAPLDRAGPHDLTFFENLRYAEGLAATARRRLPDRRTLRQGCAGRACCCLLRASPISGFVAVTRKLFADALRPSSLFEADGIVPGASFIQRHGWRTG